MVTFFVFKKFYLWQILCWGSYFYDQMKEKKKIMSKLSQFNIEARVAQSVRASYL
jgi:hypothetical protein